MYQCVFKKSYYSHNLSKFSYKSILKILKTQLFLNILFVHFSYIKILDTLCVTYHKLNGVHHCFIMKVKEFLNRFFHVYDINVIVTTWDYFFGIFYHAFTPKRFLYNI